MSIYGNIYMYTHDRIRGYEFERKQMGMWKGIEREKKRRRQCNRILISKKILNLCPFGSINKGKYQ